MTKHLDWEKVVQLLLEYVEGDECDCHDQVDEQIWSPGGGSYTTRKPGLCRFHRALGVLKKAGVDASRLKMGD